jgi:branched-chain amino acid transport system ATP-binding protein
VSAAVLLTTHALEARYGDFQALFGVDLEVGAGEVVAVIGANGAGKSTLLKTVAGLLRAPRAAVRFDGEPIGGLRAGEIARRGISMVSEGRRLFASLTVEENLRMGMRSGRRGPWNLDTVFGLFPMRSERRRHPATWLSGGQQQMVAIGRALMANPRLLMCDEISLGLAPVVVREIYDALPAIVAGGLTVVIVEQDVSLARQVSHRLYCLQEGRVTLAGVSSEVTREAISGAYFGTDANTTP